MTGPRIARFLPPALAFALAALAALPAACQDLVAVAPGAKIVYEDARIRVVCLRIAPHESVPMHDRPARVVISLTANDVTATRPDGTRAVLRSEAGRAVWSEPARRAIVNNLPSAMENVIVELKSVTGPAKALAHPPEPKPPGYLDEQYHHWFFENQYVRVYDVRVPPRVTTAFHDHAFDSVFVLISGGTTSAQEPGQPWGKAESVAPGTVQFSADSQHPRSHRVRNEGSGEYHVVVVQLLP